VKLEQEAGEIFMRWKVDSFRIGKTKNGAVYADLLHYFFTPGHLADEINYRIQENGITTFEFIGPIVLGKIDYQNSVFEVTPDPDDAYRPVLLNYNIKGNYVLTNHAYSDYDLNTNSFVNVNFTGWSDVSHSVGWANNTGGTAKARNTISTGSPMDLIVIVTAFSGDSIILRGVDGAFNPVGANVTINAIGTYIVDCDGATYLEAYNNSATLKTGSFTYHAFIIDLGDDIIRGGSVQDHITSMLGIATAYSTVLWQSPLGSDPPASIATYMTAHPTYDYVLQSAGIFNNLWYGQFWTSSNNTISFKDLMDILKIKLRIFWFIDEDGHFRLEHEKYFTSYDPQIDLTSATYAKDKPEVDSKIFTYQTADIYKQLNYNEDNQVHEDWLTSRINYTQNVNDNVNDINISIATDYGTAWAGNKLLLRMLQGTIQKLVAVDQSDITATNFYLNAKLGWHFLLRKYHTYFASSNVGDINGSVVTFDHVKEYLSQDNIKFHPVAALDWKKPATTSNGNGKILGAEYAPETGMMNINVGFNPYV
jgi:hypothetical protein